jgi:hypothetical protein
VTADRPPAVGPVGDNVRRNVEELRRAQKLGAPALSALLGGIGRPILPSVLHRLGQGKRRTDVDDLVALSLVLGVTPSRLLAAPEAAAAEDHPAVTAARALADRLGAVITAGDPETAARARVKAGIALRRACLEAEELLDGQPL